MGVRWLLIRWSGGGCALSSLSGSLSVVVRSCRMRTSGFSFYRREEPSGLRKRWTPVVFNYPPLLLPGQLDDNAGFNNCPGYSRTHCWNYCLFLLPCPLPSRDILWNIFKNIFCVYSLPRPNNWCRRHQAQTLWHAYPMADLLITPYQHWQVFKY